MSSDDEIQYVIILREPYPGFDDLVIGPFVDEAEADDYNTKNHSDQGMVLPLMKPKVEENEGEN